MKEKEIEKIVLATDFSDASKAARRYAEQLSRRLGARLILVHVFDRTAFRVPAASHLLPGVDHWLGRHFSDLKDKALEKLKKASAGLEGVEPVLLEGVPERELMKYVTDNDVDMIIMGTHGRTGLNHLVMGRVSERTIKKAPCPVLLIKPEAKKGDREVRWRFREKKKKTEGAPS
ncbi:Universal stress protein [Sulfidibacter corallicola]|uniref:Universal stress protein n=1 Tax=Sulfidibacter corallicola TaxID=2818388 RepID=A0A8A4TXI4_SULCO|nr:universal stress protein [Sulfidibacter corallicola]QTD53682.1 universal stress protein [Sulfidibacter corallicola]